MALLGFAGSLLMALNVFAAPIAIIWLIVLGEWWAVGLAALSLFSPFLISLLVLPALVFAAPAAAVAPRKPLLAVVLGLPGLLYTAAVITIWCVGSLLFLIARATPESWLPLLLLGYSIGTAPWAYLAQQELRSGSGAEGSLVATFFMQVASVLVLLYVLLVRPESPEPLWWIFGTVMAVEVVVAFVLAKAAAQTDAAMQRVQHLMSAASAENADYAMTDANPRGSAREAESELPF
jgi:hypothetical protein